jgi:hypothetical protein
MKVPRQNKIVSFLLLAAAFLGLTQISSLQNFALMLFIIAGAMLILAAYHAFLQAKE